MSRLLQKLALVSLLGALTLPAVAHAQANPNGDRPNRMQRWEQLNLTPEQRQQLSSLREQDKAQLKQLREQIKAAQTQLRQLWASNASEAQLSQQQAQLNVLKQQAQQLRFQQSLKLRAILTPEQRQQLQQQRSERRQQWRERGGTEAPN